MENIVVMVTLFAIVIVGFVAGKLGYMGGDFDKRLSSLVVDITCPALILSSTMSGQLPDRKMILPLLLISLLTYILLTGVALLVPRWLTKRRDDEGVVGFALMFWLFGFIIAVPISLFIITFMLSKLSVKDATVKHRLIISLIYGVVGGAVLYLAYVVGLKTQMPTGLLFELLKK